MSISLKTAIKAIEKHGTYLGQFKKLVQAVTDTKVDLPPGDADIPGEQLAELVGKISLRLRLLKRAEKYYRDILSNPYIVIRELRELAITSEKQLDLALQMLELWTLNKTKTEEKI